jgi:hypothetical protein
MSIDVNKIIEESVKDIIDDDKEDQLLQENEELVDGKKEETDEGLISEKQFNESRDYLKAFVGEGKKS